MSPTVGPFLAVPVPTGYGLDEDDDAIFPAPPEELTHDSDHPDDLGGTWEQHSDARVDDDDTGGLRWEIVPNDPTNPFTQRLLFADGAEELLWLDLDPVTLREIIAALAVVQAAQLESLTGQPAQSVGEETQSTAPPTRSELKRVRKNDPTRSWWSRHKALTIMLGFIAILLLYAMIAGGSRV